MSITWGERKRTFLAISCRQSDLEVSWLYKEDIPAPGIKYNQQYLFCKVETAALPLLKEFSSAFNYGEMTCR